MSETPETPRPPFVEHALAVALAMFLSSAGTFWLAHAVAGPAVPGDLTLFALSVTTGMLAYAVAVGVTLAGVALAVGRRGLVVRLAVGVPVGLACVLVTFFARSSAFGAEGAVSRTAGDLRLLLGPFGVQLVLRGLFLGIGLGLAAARTGRRTEGLALLLPSAVADSALALFALANAGGAAPFLHRALLMFAPRAVLTTLLLPLCLRFAATLLARIGLHTRASE